MSKAINRTEASKERPLADLEHLRLNTIEQASRGVTRLFGPNSPAAQSEKDTHRSEPTTEPAQEISAQEFAPNNIVSLAAERAVRTAGLDRIHADIENALTEREAEEGYNYGIQIEEQSDSVAA